MGSEEVVGSLGGGSCDSIVLIGSEGVWASIGSEEVFVSDVDSKDDGAVVSLEGVEPVSRVAEVTGCLGSGKVSSPRSCTSLRAALR